MRDLEHRRDHLLKLALVLLVLGVLLAASTLLLRDRRLLDRETAANSAPPPLGSTSGRGELVTDPRDDARQTFDMRTGRGSGSNALVIEVRWTVTGEPVTNHALRLFQMAQPVAGAQVRIALTDAQGDAMFDGLAAGDLTIHSATGMRIDTSIERGEHKRLRIQLPAGIRVSGRVVDAIDRPIPGAAIWMSAADSSTALLKVAESDANGEFALESLAFRCQLVAVHTGFLDSTPVEVLGCDRERFRVTLHMPWGVPAKLSGVVATDAGVPIAGSEVSLIALKYEPSYSTVGTRVGRHQPKPVTTDGAGRFAFDGLWPGPYRISARASGHVVGSRDIDARGEVHVELVLASGATIAGVVRRADAVGVAPGVVVVAHEKASGAATSALTDADGRYMLTDVSAGRVSVSAEDPRFGAAAREIDGVRVGESYECSLVLATGLEISGRVLGHEREALARWYVGTAVPASPGAWRQWCETDTAGAFLLRNCDSARNRIEVRRPGDLSGPVLAGLDGVDGGATDVVLVVDDSNCDGSYVTGSISSEKGLSYIDGAVVFAGDDERQLRLFPVSVTSGAFVAGPFFGHKAVIRCHAAMALPKSVDVDGLSCGERRNVGAITLTEAARVRGRLRTRGSDAPPRFDEFELLRTADAHSLRPLVIGCEFDSGPVAAGEYQARARVGARSYASSVASVAPGEQVHLDLVLDP